MEAEAVKEVKDAVEEFENKVEPVKQVKDEQVKKAKAPKEPKPKKVPKVFWTYGVRVPIEIKHRLAAMPKAEYKEFTKKIKEVLAGERPL